MVKVWFITGCSKGFGRALTEQLLTTTDAFVIATARDIATLKEFEQKYKDRILIEKLDVTNKTEIDNAIDKAITKFQRIDVLVNNAGYGLAGALEECSVQEIRAQFDTNVFGLMEITRAALPHMRKQKSGHIINISSIAGLVGFAGMGIYNSTKFAVEGFSEALASDISCFGIKVSIIEPGPFRTDFAGKSIKISSPMEEYKNSDAGSIRDYFTNANHNQTGDPIKAAQIIIKIADMKTPPLRLPLGNNAMNIINERLKHKIDELNFHEHLSRSTDYKNITC